MLLLISAITPVALFIYYIYSKDTLKEPANLLIKCFLLGVVSAIPAILLETVLSAFNVFQSPFLQSFYNAFIVAGFSEELVKFSFLYLAVWKSREFDQYYDGIVYAVCVALGFAGIENILYIMQYGYEIAFMRAILPVPMHGFCGVFMGYFFSLARFSHNPQRKNYLILSFLVPMLLHGTFNFILMYYDAIAYSGMGMTILTILFTVFIIYLWRRGLKRIREHVKRDQYD